MLARDGRRKVKRGWGVGGNDGSVQAGVWIVGNLVVQLGQGRFDGFVGAEEDVWLEVVGVDEVEGVLLYINGGNFIALQKLLTIIV